MPPIRSNLWRIFIKTSSGGRCKLCHSEVKTSGNTTNLRKHLQRKHPHYSVTNDEIMEMSSSENQQASKIDPAVNSDCVSQPQSHAPSTSSHVSMDHDIVFDETMPSPSTSTGSLDNLTSLVTPKSLSRQSSITESFSTIRSFSDGGVKSGKITNAIIYMIAKDNLPLNTCEKEGFKHLIKTLAPLYQMPGRKKITDLIDDKYDVLSSMFKKKLSDIPNVTLTSDVWTETMTTKSFLGVTCHFLLGKQLTSLTIGVFELYEKHTSQYLGERISSICEEWNIVHSKITAVVTDNGANIVKTVNDIFGKNKQLSCFAHTLDLVASKVTDNIVEIKDIIDRVRAIVTYFKQSVSAADDLRKAQSPENVLKLIQSVPTRWNSKFYMLERFVKLCDYITPILLKNPKSPSIIGAADLEIIKDVLNILGPLEAVSKEMCGEKYLTSSKVIPIVNCLLKKLENLSPSSETALELKK